MNKEVAELARFWSWRRQHLDRDAAGVEDALRSIVAVPGENPSCALALLARVPRLYSTDAIASVIRAKRGILLPSFRGKLALVYADLAADAFHATVRARGTVARLLTRAGLSQARYVALKREILLAAVVPRTPEVIAEAVARPLEEIEPAIAVMSGEGSLVRLRASGVSSDEFSFVATRTWLGSELPTLDLDQALVKLAGLYLSAFGPASAADFAWWTGCTIQQAGDALATHDPVNLGRGFLLHRRDERAFMQTPQQRGKVNLLPALDPYTSAYAEQGRRRFAGPSLTRALYDRKGDPHPIVLVEGRAVGTWSVRPSGDASVVRLALVARPSSRIRQTLIAEAELAGRFLGARETRVELRELSRR